MMPIAIITAGVLAELTKLGYAESTLKRKRNAISSIANWFDKETDGVFTEAGIERYSALLDAQFTAGILSKSWYQYKAQCLECLCLHAAGKGVCCGFAKCGPKKIEPSEAAIALTNIVLAGMSSMSVQYHLKSVLRKFMYYVENIPMSIESINRNIMIDYIRHNSGISRSHMRLIARGLTELAKYLVANEKMERIPDFKFIIPSMQGSKIVPAFTVHEVATILNSIDRSSDIGKRNYAMILLAVSTGLRAGDIIKLTLRAVNWERGEIIVVQSKTRKPHIVHISGQVRNVLSDYILNARQHTDSTNIFLRDLAPFTALSATPTKMFSRCAEKAGIEKKKGRAIHSLRRSFGTWLAKERVPFTTISQLLGHVDMDSGKPYLSFDDEQLSECAMDFTDMPLTRRIFNDIHRKA